MNTIISQGTFVSNGLPRIIPVPQGTDYFQSVNLTKINGYTANSSFRFTWYRGMGQDAAIHETNIAGSLFADTAAIVGLGGNYVGTHGFTLIDTTTQTPSIIRATTGATNVPDPIVTTANTATIIPGQTVIRLASIAATPTLCGIDYTVTNVDPGVSFTLPIHANAVGAGLAGTYRIISYSADPVYYPARRTVINITQAAQAVITTSVVSNYTVGQSIRFKVPASCGMVELDDMIGTVVAVDGQDFTVDIDTRTFTAFAWPVLAAMPSNLAECLPIGTTCATPYAASYEGATTNQGVLGVLMGGGFGHVDAQRNSPVGLDQDVIYWQAAKVYNL